MHRTQNWLKQHGHHLIFILSLLFLISLLVWWSVFIHNSIQQQRLLRISQLELQMLKFGIDAAENPAKKLKAGDRVQDERFEIVALSDAHAEVSRALPPPNSHLAIQPSLLIAQEIEDKTRRLNIMLFGEAGLLALVVLVSMVFMYRYVQLEKRTAREIHEFWERSTHEIKTPLTGIKTFLQNLRNHSLQAEQLKSYTELALQQVERQEKITENILSGFHLTQKTREIPQERIMLKPLLERYFGHSLHLKETSVHLDLENLKKKIMVLGDAYSLRVVLDNITHNAVKYASPGLNLKVWIETDARWVSIFIQDNGPGFATHQGPAMFEAFKHTDQDLPIGPQGTGIGLYLSRGLMRKLGGNLKAESKGQGQGARFQIIMRRVKNHAL